MISIRTAESEEDFCAVYRFWYQIYVKEMGRHQEDDITCHKSKQLHDRLAHRGILHFAEQSGQVVGTVLTTRADDKYASKYRDLYRIDETDRQRLARSCVTTKLMVTPALRKTRLTLRLATATYDYGMRRGMQHNYIDCNDHLVGLFEKLGFVRHLSALYHPDYGDVNSMYLGVTDRIHLASTRSPFLRLLLKFQQEQGLNSAYLHELIAQNGRNNTEVDHELRELPSKRF